jgi:nucleotide-binding universal stress UspA family protein
MNVMVAYDGSAYADAAIEDLGRAGLPRESEIRLVSVADMLAERPPVSDLDMHSFAARRIEAILRMLRVHYEREIEEARAFTAKAADLVQERFPEYKVDGRVMEGKPAEEILARAAEWPADLIVAGSQGRSAIGRFFLGSVSQRIAEKARCSVRVVRGGPERAVGEPLKLLIGAIRRSDAERVVEAVAKRSWADGTRVFLVAAGGNGSGDATVADLEKAAVPLRSVGLSVSVTSESGRPRTVLLEAADHADADAIFVAAGDGEPGLSETAARLVTGASCAVEIVR